LTNVTSPTEFGALADSEAGKRCRISEIRDDSSDDGGISRSRFVFYEYLAAVFESYVQLRRRESSKTVGLVARF
jgi:hypothetical protein